MMSPWASGPRARLEHELLDGTHSSRSGMLLCEKKEKPSLKLMLVKILIHLDVLLAVLIWKGGVETLGECQNLS